MGIISACCRKPAQNGRNRTAVSIQQAEAGKKTFFMAVVCNGHHEKTGAFSSGYAAEELTGWFWREFIRKAARGRYSVKRSLFRQMREIHEKIRQKEKAFGSANKISRRGVSVEAVLLYGKRLYYIHAGNGSCCRIRGRFTKYLGRPHVAGDGILLRTVGGLGGETPEFRMKYLKRKESFLMGACHFPGRWNQKELLRLWKPGRVDNEDTARLRLEEMCRKRLRQGEDAEQAAVIILTDSRRTEGNRT